MKNAFLLVFALLALNVSAQKKISKTIPFQNQAVEVEFDFASSIEIISWDKPFIEVQVDVWTEDQQYTDLFQLEVKEGSEKLELNSTSKDLFRAYQKDHKLFSSGVINTQSLDHEFEYTLYLPKDIKLDISSITGNIYSEYIEGDIAADLINGTIAIKDFKGNLKLESINGVIELPGKNSSIKAKTVTGSIKSHPDLVLEYKDRFIGEEVELQVRNSSNSLDLHTVNGKIILN